MQSGDERHLLLLEPHKDAFASPTTGPSITLNQTGLLSPTHYILEAVLAHGYITKFHHPKVI